MTREQWGHLNKSFSHLLTHTTLFNDENVASVVKRLGLILYRIAMIFTSLRKYENNIRYQIIPCTDEDFLLALNITEIYLQHSIIMFNNLPVQEVNVLFKKDDNKSKFFRELPHEFKRSEAVELGKKFKLSTRSVDLLLSKLNGTYLTKPTTGQYKKTNPDV